MSSTYLRMRWIVLCVVLAVCPAARADPSGTITGQVMENGFRVAELGVAVSGMSTMLAHPRMISTPDGRFTIYGVPPGKHVVRVMGWAFVEVLLPDVVVVRDKPTELGQIVVEQGVHAEGVVVDDAGTPVKNATVMIFAGRVPAIAPVFELMASGVRAALTDENGHYVIDGIEGDHLQMIAKTLALPRTEPGALSSGTLAFESNLSMVDLVVRETGGLTGTLANTTARTVTATYANDDQLVVTTEADAKGAFAFAELPIGVWDLTVDSHLAPLRAEVGAGEITLAKLVLPKQRASVTFDGTCTTLTLFGARQLEKEIGTELATKECDDNRATFRSLAPGRYRVCADGDGECSEWTLKPGTQTVQLPVAVPHVVPVDL